MAQRQRQLESVILILAFLASGWGSAHAQSKKQTSEILRTDEEKVTVEVELGGGNVKIKKTNDRSKIMDASVSYTEKKMKPDFSYEKQNKKGYLTVTGGKQNIQWWGDFGKNRWQLGLTDQVPLVFDIELGAGSGELDFSDLRVSELDLEVGACHTTLWFNSPNKETLNDLRMEAGVGQLEAYGLCNANFKNLSFEGGIGSYFLDFSGDLSQNAEVTISIGVGECLVIIPENLNAEIETEGSLFSTISVPGDQFEKIGKQRYQNKNPAGSSKRVKFFLQAGVGKIEVRGVKGKKFMKMNIESDEMVLYEKYKNIMNENVILSLTGIGDDDFQSKGFTLKKPMVVRIYALGEGIKGKMYDYGWIMDADSKEKIWEMDFYKSSHAGGSKKNRLVDETLGLPKGSYIVNYVSDDSHSAEEWNLAEPRLPQHWGITILETDQEVGSDVKVVEKKSRKTGKIVASLKSVTDDNYRKESFELKQDSNVRIFSIGEGLHGTMYDYGWIEESETGKVIWEMTYKMTSHAGGADKNRVVDTDILLRKGKYTLYFITDDSHSYANWNDSPPYNPDSWGITLFVNEKE